MLFGLNCQANHKKPREQERPEAHRRFDGKLLAIAALRAYAFLIEGDTAERAALNFLLYRELCASCVHTAGEGNLGDVELVLEQFIDDLDHAFNCHGLLGHNETGVRIGGSEGGLEGLTLHLVLRVAVLDALLLINVKDGRKKRIVLPENERMVEVLENVPGNFLNLVARVNHVNTWIYAILNLDGEDTGMSVKILCFALESIETMGVLKVECGDASHMQNN